MKLLDMVAIGVNSGLYIWLLSEVSMALQYQALISK